MSGDGRWGPGRGPGHPVFHNYTELTKRLHELPGEFKCHGLYKLFSIGRSVLGRELWTARLTEGAEEAKGARGKPEFLYVGNIHGDETLGRELLLRLAQDLCERYAAGDAYVRWLLKETDIFIVFSANPDGYEEVRRQNHNGKDLNRNFPDQVPALQDSIQPETRALMGFLREHKFALGANLHAGTLVCNYPWDALASGHLGHETPSVSPDDALYRHLCTVYSRAHPLMHASKEFPGGITNGAAYFAVYGGLQDYAYSKHGMLHVTLELGYTKELPRELLAPEWDANSQALYDFMEQVHTGVQGRVTCSCEGDADADHGEPASATITFSALDSLQPPGPVPLAQVIRAETSSVRGDYHRPLQPGEYLATVSGCGGVVLAGRTVVVPESSRDAAGVFRSPVVENFALQRQSCDPAVAALAEKASDAAVESSSAGVLGRLPGSCLGISTAALAAFFVAVLVVALHRGWRKQSLSVLRIRVKAKEVLALDCTDSDGEVSRGAADRLLPAAKTRVTPLLLHV
mmetsp:Transcript_84684/g.218285  ORF Transcript_84684/g.218285 Transcript_84684/m.218285 type:complete len:518 (-) Transcript_84684:6-1559(-)